MAIKRFHKNPAGIGRWSHTAFATMTNRILFEISGNLPDTHQLIICGFVVRCTSRIQNAHSIPVCYELVKFLQSICSLVTYNRVVALIQPIWFTRKTFRRK